MIGDKKAKGCLFVSELTELNFAINWICFEANASIQQCMNPQD